MTQLDKIDSSTSAIWRHHITPPDMPVAFGEKLVLSKGETGYIKGGRVHDAKYLEDCKLVFVHDKAFAFRTHGE